MRRMYSLAQIQAIVALMAKEGKLDFSDVDLKVKTIKQSQPNWSLDISEIPLDGLPEGIEYSPIYARLEQVGNLLYIVWCYTLENKTEEAITVGNPDMTITLPENIAEKIFDFAGNSAKESSNSPISADVAFRGDNSYPNSLNRVVANYTLNNLTQANKIKLYVFGWTSINAGVKQIACFRTFLTLL